MRRVEWTAAFFGVLGALLLALPMPPALGFGSFLVSNGFWIAYSKRARLKGMFAQQLAFTATSLIGLWNWWIGPILLGA
jgi:hypothetical protein